jgi:WhiB family transcriptional regulator, redox-sensing transcriptional regulator
MTGIDVASALATREQEGWRDLARCQTDNAVHFYAPSHFERKPEKDRRESQARALCRACAVRAECLAESLRSAESHGIWGGLNELERKRLLRRYAAEREARSA